MCTRVEPQAFFVEPRKRKHTELNGQKSDKSEQEGQKGAYLKPLRGQKVICLIGNAKSRFAKLCSPLEQEALF